MGGRLARWYEEFTGGQLRAFYQDGHWYLAVPEMWEDQDRSAFTDDLSGRDAGRELAGRTRAWLAGRRRPVACLRRDGLAVVLLLAATCCGSWVGRR